MRVTRRDAGELARPERTQEGFLRVEGVIARACILEYQGHDGAKRHELVTPETLFDDASMRSFSVLALTNNHPIELLTPQSVSAHQIGTVGEPRRVGDSLVSLLGVLRADAVAAVESGKAALSCGYSAEIDETPGEHPTLRCPQCGTGHYDGVQKDRRGNHVAVVDAARAGGAAAIRLDAAGNVCLTPAPNPETLPFVATQQTTENPPMPDLRIDSITIKADAADAQQVIDRQLAVIRADAAKALDDAKQRADAAEKTGAEAVKRADAATAKVKATRARLDAMMKRAVTCDECMGAKTMDGVKCPSCDGEGMHSARDMIKAMPVADDMMSPDEDIAAMEDAAGETPDAPPVDPAKMDAAKHARAEARKVAQAKRRDSLERIADRRAKVRAALLSVAGKHVDAADLDGKTDAEIKRAVIAKVAPHLDAATLDASAIGVLYDAEIKRLEASAVNPSIALTEGMFPAPRADAAPTDSIRKFIAANEAAMRPDLKPAVKA